MRLKPLTPADMNDQQRALNETMQAGVKKNLHGFISQDANGALIGPFPAMLHFPQFGEAAWAMFTALSQHSTLPKPVHEIAILVTGARFHSRYELYAHERVAAGVGLAEDKIATITAGQRPADLSRDEGLAYDVAAVVSAGGQLHDTLYKTAVAAFSEQGVAELLFLVGSYCMIGVLLNGYDVPTPE